MYVFFLLQENPVPASLTYSKVNILAYQILLMSEEPVALLLMIILQDAEAIPV
jgi:hypothetical protein